MSIDQDALMDAVNEAKDCLEGLTIVVTGCFNTISRDKIVELITDYGARNTGSVSGKTDYLIAGFKLDDGREASQGRKYCEAKKKNIPIFHEDEFEKFMQMKTGDPDFCLGEKLVDLDPIAEESKDEI